MSPGSAEIDVGLNHMVLPNSHVFSQTCPIHTSLKQNATVTIKTNCSYFCVRVYCTE